MDIDLSTIGHFCTARLDKEGNLPQNYPLWLKLLKTDANAEEGGKTQETYYLALMAQMLVSGDEVLLKRLVQNGIPQRLVTYLQEKIQHDNGDTNDDLAEIRKKSVFQSILVSIKSCKTVVFFKKATLIKLFKEQDGFLWLLDMPRTDVTFFGSGYVLEKIGFIKEIMRWLCDKRLNVDKVVKLSLDILAHKEGRLSSTQRHIAKFFVNAFPYKPLLCAFDKHKGLPVLLLCLQGNRLVGSVGVLLSKFEIETEGCLLKALHCYFNAHLVIRVDSIQSPASCVRAPTSHALDISGAAMDDIWRRLNEDHARSIEGEWSVVSDFLKEDGHMTMLGMCTVTKSSYLNENIQHVLGVLSILSLVTLGCLRITEIELALGVAYTILLVANPDRDEAIPSSPYVHAKNTIPALRFLENIFRPHTVSVPSTTSSDRRAIREQPSTSTAPSTSALPSSDRQDIATFIENNGLEILADNLQPEEHEDPNFNKIWTLTCRIFLMIAKEDRNANALRKLNVHERLLKLTKDHPINPYAASEVKDRERVTLELIEVLAKTAGRSGEGGDDPDSEAADEGHYCDALSQ